MIPIDFDAINHTRAAVFWRTCLVGSKPAQGPVVVINLEPNPDGVACWMDTWASKGLQLVLTKGEG